MRRIDPAPYDFLSNYSHLTKQDYELLDNAIDEMTNHRPPNKHEREVQRKVKMMISIHNRKPVRYPEDRTARNQL